MIYHRPNHQTDPNDPLAEVAFKKIKKQKITGVKGAIQIEYDFKIRRFLFEGKDEMQVAIDQKFTPVQQSINTAVKSNNNFLKTYKDDYEQPEYSNEPAPF